MKIRPATIADVPRLMEIERQSATAAHWTEQNYMDAIDKPEPRRNVLVLEMPSPDERTSCSVPGIAAFSVTRCFENEWEIENLAVDQSLRRRGYASELLQKIFQQVRSDGGRHIFLEVRESNEAARKLYERWGFRQSGRRRGYYRDPEEDALVLEEFFPPHKPENS